jgi:hypothetical protein
MKIKTINTIELSSICDNKCAYCPAPVQGQRREIGYMDEATFKAAIDWVLVFARAGTQLELNLFGVGESLLNPNVVDFVAYARRQLPFGQKIHISTNGNNVTKEGLISLERAGISSIDITDHKPKTTAAALRAFRAAGPSVQKLLRHISRDFVYSPNNWARQIDWFEPDDAYPKTPCPWLQRGQIMVMSNGDLTTCCIDAFAEGKFGTIADDLSTLEMRAHELCRHCHHTLPVAQMRYMPQSETPFSGHWGE